MPRESLSLMLLLLVVAGLFLLPAQSPTAAATTEADNSDGTKTVTWTFEDGAGFDSMDIRFGPAGAELRRTNETVVLNSTEDFVQAGSTDPNGTILNGSVHLKGDWTNRISDGGFSADGTWDYSNDGGGTKSGWDPSNESAYLTHEAGAANETMFDGLDSLAGWFQVSSPGASSIIYASSERIEGEASMRDAIGLPNAVAWAGAARSLSGQDWSSYDRLMYWVKGPSSPVELATYVWIRDSTFSGESPPLRLGPGWNEVVVDLDQLGVTLSSVLDLHIRFRTDSPSGASASDLLVDAVRLTRAKVGTEWANVRSVYSKNDNTSAASGTAILSFDWWAGPSLNLADATLSLALTGPSGGVWHNQTIPPGGFTGHVTIDASAELAGNGTYEIVFSLTVSLDTVYASGIDAGLDNVTLVLPGMRDSTYATRPLDAGVPVEWRSVRWLGRSDPETAVEVSARFGNTPTVGDPTWTSPVSVPGGAGVALDLEAFRFAQIVVILTTQNGSRTPYLDHLDIGFERHAAAGWVTTDEFAPPIASFLRWRRFDVKADIPNGTRLTFELVDAAGATPVDPGANLTSVSAASLWVRARFETLNGTLSPRLESVSITYEFRGPLDRLEIVLGNSVISNLTLNSGESRTFLARAFDQYDHPLVPSVEWSTTCQAGLIEPRTGNVTAVFTAGEPTPNDSFCFVNATAPGKTATVRITVLATPPLSGLFPLEWFALIALSAFASGYIAYAVAIRRIYAVDDIFIISREGRLIMHNTRRLRPDRDEDILAGMLTAIVAFIRDSFREENGDVNRFDFAGKTILIERGAHVYVAAIYTGRVPRWGSRDLKAFVNDLEAAFGAEFETWSGATEDLADMKDLTDRFVSGAHYRSPYGTTARQLFGLTGRKASR